jgi:Tfp pilus assembly protein PilV
MKLEKEKGSVLVLTIIAVLILSIMVTGLLTVGTTEIYTTQNFHLKKSAYYTAVQGVEEIRNQIYNTPDAMAVADIVKMPPANAYTGSGGFLKFYVTGSLKDLEEILAGTNTDGVRLEQFKGFEPPPLAAISLGQGSSIQPIVWKVQVTAKIDANKRSTYSEILSGVYSVLTVGY